MHATWSSLDWEIFCVNMKIFKYLTLCAVIYLTGNVSFAQSQSFKLGQWTEINNAIIKELNKSYVDTLPISRIERKGIDAMLESLDPYTVYVPEEENEDFQMMIGKTYGGIGAVIYKPQKSGHVFITEPYANSPASRAGLTCGDEILEIDGVTTEGLETKECSDRMKGKPGTDVVFKIKRIRGGQIEDVAVKRERIHLPDVEYAGMVNDTTGYILQTGFTENVSAAVRESVLKLKAQGMKLLVLDLRGNGGGLLNEAVNIVSLFVPKGSLAVSQKGLSLSEEIQHKTVLDPVDTETPMIVMVNGGTASASEIIAGALQDYDRATIIGKRTYGKGLVQSIRPLPYNGQLKVTTAKYYTPSGRCVQAIDYAKRGEDGSVAHIPDSLTHEFKTLAGRTVRDGGGISPDIEIDDPKYSRIVYSLVLNGIVEQFAFEYVKSHPSIPATVDFHLSDSEYQDFVKYAKDKDFDYRSSAKTLFDQMKKELQEDGLAESVAPELDALDKAIDLDKENFLNQKRDELLQFIEEEIVVRYYFQEAGIKIRLRYDGQLKEALAKYTPFGR